jgi:glutamyl-tRNA synthetase
MVVTRFAPSPTGYLHVGGARTALFSWLLARRTGGKFILRIEDTDLKRNTPTATQQVINDLRWLGIDWDEGPEIEGPNGPYFQSQRRDIYEKYISKLIEGKKAYYCFDTPEELQQMRKQAEKEKQSFLYPRPDTFPTNEEAQEASSQGKPVTIRFVVPQDKPLVVNDIVRGEVTFPPGEFSDFIIQKSDGFPTYNFACVVDDALMGITHVVRGQEHLMNTPGQLELWKALFDDIEPPTYAHMSVTVSDSGGKLSKRERPKALRNAIKQTQDIDTAKLAEIGSITTDEVDSFIKNKTTPDMPSIDAMAEHLGVALPEINVVDFFKSGYLPETMINFLALLGWNPGNDREIMSLQELIDCFDITRLTKSNSLFDRQKLIAFNTEHMRMLPAVKLLEHFKKYLKLIESPVLSADDEALSKILKLSEGARTLADIERKSRFLFVADDQLQYDPKAVKKILLKGDALGFLKIIRDELAQMQPLTEDNIEKMLRSLAEEKQVGLGKVAQPLRVALCGTTVSLPIFNSVQMLGRESTLARIDNTIKEFTNQSNQQES